MRPPSVNDVRAGRSVARLRLLNRHRNKSMSGARGHAAKIFLLLFVTVLAATKQCVNLADARLATAVMTAVKLSAACVIVNVSGWLATDKRDASSAVSSIKPGDVRGVLVPPSNACPVQSLTVSSRLIGRQL